eukprot:1063131_1
MAINYSAQEVAFHNLGLSLVDHPKIQLLKVGLFGGVSCFVDANTNQWKATKSLVDIYSERMKYVEQYPQHDFENMNLDTFLRTFDANSRTKSTSVLKLRPQKKDRLLVIDYFPSYKPYDKEKLENWCKYELIKYKPWTDNMDDAIPENTDNDAIIQYYQDWINSPWAKQHLSSDVINRLENLNVQIDDFDDIEDENEAECDDAMLLAAELGADDIDPEVRANLESFADHDWNENQHKYSPDCIKTLESWIVDQKTSHVIPKDVNVVDK